MAVGSAGSSAHASATSGTRAITGRSSYQRLQGGHLGQGSGLKAAAIGVRVFSITILLQQWRERSGRHGARAAAPGCTLELYRCMHRPQMR
jgi:hypothetical protein